MLLYYRYEPFAYQLTAKTFLTPQIRPAISFAGKPPTNSRQTNQIVA